eukprot:c19779_g1_i1.p1 GENE.c19779_g1_i1~~c19779_g1_i1.p1  ORF type:complete len:308 (+),score=31.19 c19779_g1_i1:65-988(+)
MGDRAYTEMEPNPFGGDEANPFDNASGSHHSSDELMRATGAAPDGATGVGSAAGTSATGGESESFGDRARSALSSAGRSGESAKDALARRVRELDLRERALDAREAALPRLRPANFPVCFKVVHHDIENDIPAAGQKTVRTSYMVWYGFAFVAFFNMVAYIVVLADPFKNAGKTTLGMAISVFVFLFGVPLAFLLSHRPLYSAVRTQHAGLYWMYFFMIFLQCLLCIAAAIGPLGTGGAGFLLGLRAFADKSKAAGAFCFISGALWIVLLIASCCSCKRGYSRYRAAGLTFKDAQSDISKGVVAGAL